MIYSEYEELVLSFIKQRPHARESFFYYRFRNKIYSCPRRDTQDYNIYRLEYDKRTNTITTIVAPTEIGSKIANYHKKRKDV